MKVLQLAIALFLLWALSAEAQQLKLGDKAPALQISKWIKGEPIPPVNDSKKIYVLEFWATWSDSYPELFPLLTKLQKTYKDHGVVIIGVCDDVFEEAQKFVADQGDKIDYRIAIDDDKKTWNAYALPFAVDGVPHAFIIGRNGDLLWQGHPKLGFEEALAEVVAGTYDLKKEFQKAEEEERQMKLLEEYIELAVSGSNKAAADKLGEKFLNMPNVQIPILGTLAWNILVHDDYKYRNLAFALKLSEKANELSKSNDARVLDTYALALFENGKVEEANKQAQNALKLCTDDEWKTTIQDHLKKFKDKSPTPAEKAKK